MIFPAVKYCFQAKVDAGSVNVTFAFKNADDTITVTGKPVVVDSTVFSDMCTDTIVLWQSHVPNKFTSAYLYITGTVYIKNIKLESVDLPPMPPMAPSPLAPPPLSSPSPTPPPASPAAPPPPYPPVETIEQFNAIKSGKIELTSSPSACTANCSVLVHLPGGGFVSHGGLNQNSIIATAFGDWDRMDVKYTLLSTDARSTMTVDNTTLNEQVLSDAIEDCVFALSIAKRMYSKVYVIAGSAGARLAMHLMTLPELSDFMPEAFILIVPALNSAGPSFVDINHDVKKVAVAIGTNDQYASLQDIDDHKHLLNASNVTNLYITVEGATHSSLWTMADFGAIREFVSPVSSPVVTTIANSDQTEPMTTAANVWKYVMNIAAITDGETSRLTQRIIINVISLPEGGANYRVLRSDANGQTFFSPESRELVLGMNIITLPSTTFNRLVRVQFDSGDVSFDRLVVNSVLKYPA